MARRKKIRAMSKLPRVARANILSAIIGTAITAYASPAFAMHIAEGILPFDWCLIWAFACAPFLMWGLKDLRRRSETVPQTKPLIGLVGAAVFVFSCMPVPVPTAGTCSHPTGIGLAAILIGPQLAVVITSVALLLQALFMAHGGLTTLGANIFSMGVIGGFMGFAAFAILRRLGSPRTVAAFGAGLVADWTTYLSTSIMLALGLHGDTSVGSMFTAIAAAFVPTQLPLGIFEGVVTAWVCRFVWERRPDFATALSKKGAA